MQTKMKTLKKIINLLPGMKSPTVLPLAESGWSSIHSVIKEDKFWEVIENLKKRRRTRNLGFRN